MRWIRLSALPSAQKKIGAVARADFIPFAVGLVAQPLRTSGAGSGMNGSGFEKR